jgi:hypothetical protein
MHVMFTRISRQNLNKLNDYIYSLSGASGAAKVPRI